LSIQNEAISLVAMRSKELWLVQENHTTVKLDWNILTMTGIASRGVDLQKKQNWIAKFTILEEHAGKLSQVSFCHQSSPVSRNIAVVEKIQSENFLLRSTLKTIRFDFWTKGALVTVEICVPCGWWFSCQFHIVSETPWSCDTFGREL